MTKSPDEKRPLPPASSATEAAMEAALQAALSRNDPSAKAKRVAEAKLASEPMPPLAPVLDEPPGTSAEDQARFMSAVNDWSTSTTWLRLASLEDLPAIPRMLRLLYWFRADAITEGMWYFISESWGGRYWEDLRRACATIEATDTLRAMSAVDALFPEGFPTAEDEMQAMMAAFEAMQPDPLSAIDKRFAQAFQDEIPERLYQYLRDNASAVAAAHLP